MKGIHLLILDGVSILEQLRLEEALLRLDTRNWCVVNTGSSDAIVMGISGTPRELINPLLFQSKPVPVIKRYSGGGTVYIDPNTVFVSWIFNADAHAFSPNPQALLEWSTSFYQEVFPGSRLEAQDYVFGDKKFGGNAQYIQKSRWVHHTSFLWDFSLENMEYLQLPQKRPLYRGVRSHEEFLCRLRPLFPCKHALIQLLAEKISQTYPVLPFSETELSALCHRPHRQATTLLREEEILK